MLSVLGQTINVMTLGGLALAVGILVDDATVTIENINYHLEMGKEVEEAIMDGARQIVVPATVSLLCICIVFVPMFGLGGVAGYLFRPLAEAVVFAMIGSYILSRTLVPTLANFLLLQARASLSRCRGACGARKSLFVRFSGHSSTASSGCGAAMYRAAGTRPRLARTHDHRLLRHRLLSASGCCRSWAATSFRLMPTRTRSSCMCGRRPARASRTFPPCAARIEDGHHAQRSFRLAPDLDSIVDNIGMPISGINHGLWQFGHDRRRKMPIC